MNRQRILMISYHTCPLASEEGKETGGMNVYVLELSKKLAQLGHHVDVITRCQDPTNEKIVQVTKNFRVIHLIAGPPSPLNKNKIAVFIPEFIKSFRSFNQTQKIKYDLLHAHYYLSGLIGLKINRYLAKKIPLVMTFHTLALIKNLVARTSNEQENQSRIKAEITLTAQADVIITPSLSEKKYLLYLYDTPPKKVHVLPPGVNTDLFKPLDKTLAKKKVHLLKNDKVILFVGRIEPLKGIDVLLYALKILKAQSADRRLAERIKLKLLIVGGDISQHITKWSKPLKELTKISRLLGLTNQVIFVGQRLQYELRYYYNAAEIVVMPSHYESFGMAVAEAMACGTPVITTNVTGVSSLIDERRTHLVTTVNNPLLLASQIKRLLTNKKIYNLVRKNIIQNVQDLRWDKIAKRVEDVYSKLI